MHKNVAPRRSVTSIFDLDAQWLYGRGIRYLIMDLDNTLIPWSETRVTPELIQWICALKQVGIVPLILSNNSLKRAQPVCDALGIECLPDAGKPWKGAYERAAGHLGAPIEQCAYVGDQLFTDIMGANRAGIYSILVEPITPREFIGTKFSRLIERISGRKITYTLDPRQVPGGGEA